MSDKNTKYFLTCMQETKRALVEAEARAYQRWYEMAPNCKYRRPHGEFLGEPDHACGQPSYDDVRTLWLCRKSNCPYVAYSLTEVWELQLKLFPNKKKINQNRVI